ncbi:MAG: hypothetical protein HYU66_20640, partial [Armatimonadetes bacterium]|nr:hypothetical protein [Armatimonadota bacterium]
MALLLLALFLAPAIAAPEPAPLLVRSSLPTWLDYVPQLAFDGRQDSYFWSHRPPKAGDCFTLRFVQPVNLNKAEAQTGRSDGLDPLEHGVLETSIDGETFTNPVPFENGSAVLDGGGRAVRALRIRATEDGTFWLAVREIDLETTPALPAFQYPFEVRLDCSEAPDLAVWAQQIPDLLERWWPVMAEML